jgi:menaquinone-dependent protoporphyrinogen oxidase
LIGAPAGWKEYDALKSNLRIFWKGQEMKANKVLVAYATSSGSTQEIAEFVAKELAGQGVNVKVQPCRLAMDILPYDAVVLGAPLYMFHLHKEALHFLGRHQKLLVTRPVAVFAGGPYGENARKDAPAVRKNLDEELAKFPWFKPVSVQLVGGRFDPARLRFPYNLIPALKQSPASDARDWDEIGAWARQLPSLLNSSSLQLEAAESRPA